MSWKCAKFNQEVRFLYLSNFRIRRLNSANFRRGLTVLLDANSQEYFVTSEDFVGFKVPYVALFVICSMLHNQVRSRRKWHKLNFCEHITVFWIPGPHPQPRRLPRGWGQRHRDRAGERDLRGGHGIAYWGVFIVWWKHGACYFAFLQFWTSSIIRNQLANITITR